ncbi:MAG: GspE/PulE family protein [Candidatus Falkowbacteria bacterium]
MNIDKKKLEELLVSPGHILKDDFDIAAKEAEAKKISLSEWLTEKNLIKDEQLGQLIANAFNYAFINLRNEKIDENILNGIPEPVARARRVIVFAADQENIKVGMSDPEDLEMKHLLEKRFGKPAKVYYITPGDLKEALSAYRISLEEEFSGLLKKGEEQDGSRVNVAIVDLLLENGFLSKASDIHVEPYRDKLVVRFRIDGILHDVLEMPKVLSEPVLSRIKIMAKMRIDEHRSAQDGKFRFKTSEKTIDVRVSIVPVTQGENIVIRLLVAENRDIDLNDLGLSANDLRKIERAVKNPHGMLLVTGPTGCGKTTTVYAMLKILNTKEVNISTIEDPVEYDIAGVSQIQVNPKTNLTFAEGLRAIVRQDPDIIMVGEVRDSETAEIAVNSAMTGHLVLSTLHANDAISALPRLIDMGIEPFLVAATVKVIIAQRLVRKICAKCRVSYELSAEEKDTIRSESALLEILKTGGYGDLDKLRLYRGKGCKVCGETGFSGRIGIYEVLETKEGIRKLILAKESNDAIKKEAVAGGMSTMLSDGVDKVLNGVTTMTEVLRVAKE